MKIQLINLIIFFTLIACVPMKEIEVRTYEATADDVVIRGNNIEAFFIERPYLNFYSKKTSSNRIQKTLNEIKNEIGESGRLDYGSGSYDYVYLWGADTLYSDYTLKIFRYKGKSLLLSAEMDISNIAYFVKSDLSTWNKE